MPEQRKEPGRGSVRTHMMGVKRIVVAFDDETFEEIRQRAAREGRSFAAAVRDLVEWGLQAEGASDDR